MVNKSVQDPCVRSAVCLGQSGVGLNVAELAQCGQVGEEMGVKGKNTWSKTVLGHGARQLFVNMLLEENVVVGQMGWEECMDL